MGHAVNVVEMVDNKPHIFDFICTYFNGISPRFVPVSSGSPKEIPYIVESYCITIDVGRRRQFTVGIPIVVQLRNPRPNSNHPNQN